MRPLSGAVSAVMGGLGWVRQQASSLVAVSDRPFKGARTGRASAGFEGDRRHLNSAIRQGGSLLRERSRFLCRENPIAISAKSIFAAYAVGTGLLPAPDGLPVKRRQAVLKAFYAWCRQCDFDGVLDFFGIQNLVAEEVFEAGEIFIRLRHSVSQPLQLQMLTSEQLPYAVSNAQGVGTENTVRLGIECDPDGRRVAYHFYRYHPGDATVPMKDRNLTVRVPADEVLHIYKVRQPGQLRGIPATVGALIPANKLTEFEQATIERAISGSKVSGIIKKSPSDRGSGGSGITAGATDNKDGTANLDFEVGTILELEDEEEWVTVAPPDVGANYADFTYRQDAASCAAMGVPYLEVTGDLRRATFSAARVGRIPFKRRIEQWQHLLLSVQMLWPIWVAWLRDALLRGSISLPRGAPRVVDAYSAVRWVAPKWEYLEPLKDRQAEKLAVDELFVPRSDVIAASGEDPEEIDRKIAEDQKRERRLKLVRPAAKGPPPAPDDPDAEEPADSDKEEEPAS